MSSTVLESRKMTKGERTAQKILDVAERLFAMKGFDGTSLREIAEEVEIQEPGLYRHFPSKEALYHSVLERSMGPLMGVLAEVVASGANDESMRRLPGKVMDLMAEHPHTSFLFQQAVMSDPENRTETNTWLEKLLQQGMTLMRESMAHQKGAVNEAEAVVKMLTLFNICVGYFSSANIIRGMLGKEPDDAEVLEKQKLLIDEISGLWLSD